MFVEKMSIMMILFVICEKILGFVFFEIFMMNKRVVWRDFCLGVIVV